MVGNSDGIGLATTRRLLAAGWNIIGISRSESPITNTNYHHRVADVSDSKYSDCQVSKANDEVGREISFGGARFNQADSADAKSRAAD